MEVHLLQYLLCPVNNITSLSATSSTCTESGDVQALEEFMKRAGLVPFLFIQFLL